MDAKDKVLKNYFKGYTETNIKILEYTIQNGLNSSLEDLNGQDELTALRELKSMIENWYNTFGDVDQQIIRLRYQGDTWQSVSESLMMHERTCRRRLKKAKQWLLLDLDGMAFDHLR